MSVYLSVCLSVLSVSPSANIVIGHNFLTVRDRAFIFGMSVHHDILPFWWYHQFWKMWPWPWSFTYFWNTFNIGHNLSYPKRCGFHILHVCSLWQGLSDGTIIFERVTLTLTFELLLKKSNIGHNLFILKGMAFIFDMCVFYDKAFPLVPLVLNMWPLP